jgi:hypothetical protein
MYYHVQVSLNDGSPVNSLDNADLEDVKQKVLAYLLGEDFFLGGAAIRANRVKTLIVARSQDKSSECVNLAYSRMPMGAKEVVTPEACVFGDERFSEDVTESVITQLKNNPKLRRKHSAIEIWTVAKTPEHLADLLSTVTNLYITAKDLLDKETERRYGKFRLKAVLIGLINYAAFIFFLWKFDFHTIVHPAIIVAEVTLHLVAVFFLLFGREYEPRKLLKAKKENIREQVYDENQFKELDIRKK